MGSKANRYRKNKTRSNKSKKNKTMKKGDKKWVTAITAAQKTLSKTGSISKARQALKTQALSNARRLFGSVGEKL